MKDKIKVGGFKLSILAAVCMTGVLEYMAAELVELAGNQAKDYDKRTITPRFIMLAIRNDEELNELLSNVTIPGAGVPSNIHPFLNVKKGSKRSKK